MTNALLTYAVGVDFGPQFFSGDYDEHRNPSAVRTAKLPEEVHVFVTCCESVDMSL